MNSDFRLKGLFSGPGLLARMILFFFFSVYSLLGVTAPGKQWPRSLE